MLAFTLAVLVPATAGFGYAQDDTAETVVAGDTVTFPLYLFGDEGTVSVANVSAPQEWDVQAYPESVTFPAAGDYKRIETADGYRKLVPVDITAAVPWDATNGPHRVSVTLSMAETPDDPGLTLKKTHVVGYTVNVTGGATDTESAKPGTETGVEHNSESTNDTGSVTTNTVQETDRQTSDTDPETGRLTGNIGASNTLVLGLLLFELLWLVAFMYVWRR